MTTTTPSPPAVHVDPVAPPPTPIGRVAGVVAGLVAAIAALGVAELVAAASRAWQSPVVSVGNRVVEFVPEPVKQFAIRTFGEDDKIALLAGIGVLLAIYAAVVGLVARRDVVRGMVGIGLFGVVGALAALNDANADVTHLLPTLLGTSAGVVVLWLLLRTPRPVPAGAGRRGFVRNAGLAGAAGLAAAAAGRSLSARFAAAVQDARAAFAIPGGAQPVNLPLPDGINPVDGITPFVTDVEDFYRVDINLSVPQVDPATHRLRVVGMVERELDLSMQDLLDMPAIRVPITLTCVSNQVGGDLAGNVVWQGVLLSDVLQAAGVDPAATQVVGRSVDDFTAGFPVEAAFDRNAIVAYAMNDEPLPPEHGFPIRLVVPGLYGYTSATKWLGEIELTTFEDFADYWVSRGWTPGAPIRTFSRIDTPSGFSTPGGPSVIGGVAWAQERGIDRVEVRVDDGDWQEATLHPVPSVNTWRQWTLPWDPAPGRHTITVRATDATGATQPEERRTPKPDGVTGWHTIAITVAAA